MKYVLHWVPSFKLRCADEKCQTTGRKILVSIPHLTRLPSTRGKGGTLMLQHASIALQNSKCVFAWIRSQDVGRCPKFPFSFQDFFFPFNGSMFWITWQWIWNHDFIQFADIRGKTMVLPVFSLQHQSPEIL